MSCHMSMQLRRSLYSHMTFLSLVVSYQDTNFPPKEHEHLPPNPDSISTWTCEFSFLDHGLRSFVFPPGEHASRPCRLHSLTNCSL